MDPLILENTHIEVVQNPTAWDSASKGAGFRALGILHRNSGESN